MPETRTLTLKTKTTEGSIARLYAFIEGHRVIAVDGNEEGAFEGAVPTTPLRLKVRVFGIADATYTLGIDLPGTANDQELTLQLSQGYHELELYI